MIYDIIIVGAGIAGLYAAYKIKKSDPKSKVLVLESESQVGGRAGTHKFNGVNVPSGAGVGRKKKDVLLIELLKELNISHTEFETEPHFSTTIFPRCTLKKTFLELRSKYNPKNHAHLTFRKFALSILDADAYHNFVTCSGYSDYENENAHDTLYNYGFDDNYKKWTAMGISWKTLLEKLVSNIGKKNIHCSKRVSKIDILESGVGVIVENAHRYECQKLILATTINCLRSILPGSNSKNSPYQYVHSQSFLRIYGKFTKDSSVIMKEICPRTTVVPGPLHKIIPMDSDKGVYMIAYTDNKAANLLEKYAENTPKNRSALCKIMEIAFGISIGSLELSDMIPFYWKEGTHYYDPLPSKYSSIKEFIQEIQHPHPNILVIGELASKNKGWVEGSLESVESIL
jgi:phytoene dehydrogenase-like protein